LFNGLGLSFEISLFLQNNTYRLPIYCTDANDYRREDIMSSQYKYWKPYIGPFDPCPPIKVKVYATPPQLYMGFQPPGLPQFPTPQEALLAGTLWPQLFSPYPPPKRRDEK